MARPAINQLFGQPTTINLGGQPTATDPSLVGGLVDAHGNITLTSNRRIELRVGNNSIVIDTKGITLRGTARLELVCANQVVLSAPAAQHTAAQIGPAVVPKGGTPPIRPR